MDSLPAITNGHGVSFISNSLMMTGATVSMTKPTLGNILFQSGKFLSDLCSTPQVSPEHRALAHSSMLVRNAAEAYGDLNVGSFRVPRAVVEEIKTLLTSNDATKDIFTDSATTPNAIATRLIQCLRSVNQRNSAMKKLFAKQYNDLQSVEALSEAQKVYILYMLGTKPTAAEKDSVLAKLYEFLGVQDAAGATADATKKVAYETVLGIIDKVNTNGLPSTASLLGLGRAGADGTVAPTFRDTLDLGNRMLSLMETEENPLNNPATDLRVYEILDKEVASWHRHHFQMLPSEAKQVYDAGMYAIDHLQVYRGTGNGETVFSEPIDGEMFYHISREAFGDSAEDHPYFGFESFRKDGAIIAISLNTFMRDAAHEYWDGFSTNRVADRLYVEFNVNSFAINDASEITPWYMDLGYNGAQSAMVCKVFTIYDNIYYIDRNNNLNVADTLIPLQEGRAPASE